MNGADVVRRLHEHRIWANRRLLEAAWRVAPGDLRQPLAIGQGSLWKSLTHMFAAEYVWLEALRGRASALAPGDAAGKLPGNQEGPEPIASLDALAALWRDLDERWQAYLQTLADARLDELVAKVSSQGVRHELRRGDILLHVCTHAHYTTAQVINMLRQLGVGSLPDPMLITLAREESAPG